MENIKKAKVTKVTGNGTWVKDNVTYFKWEVEFENGDIGGAMTKKNPQDKWVVGKEVSYIIETKGNFTNVKIVEEKPKYQGQPKNEKLIVAQSCIGYACNLYLGKQTDTDTVLEVAEKFYQWALKKGGVE